MLLFTRNFISSKFTLLVLISLNHVTFSHGATRNQRYINNYHVIHFGSFPSKPNCSGFGTHKMRLSHVYGPCSPYVNLTKFLNTEEILVKNEARVQHINGRFSNSNSYTAMGELDGKSSVDERAPSIGDDGAQYLTTIGLGTPKVDYKLIMDTGSDYTWVRCKPCQDGCTSASTLYDPSKSLTYRNGSKEFNMGYVDTSYTKGFWSYDKLTLDTNVVINAFKFGCAQHIVDPGHDNFAGADGVLGLGRGDLSLVSQSTSKFGKVFGYCLPKSPNNTGYLLFGDEARIKLSSPALQSTQLLKDPPVSRKYKKNSSYFLQLVGISVGRNRLNIASDVFTSVGTIIDSGTVVTHLPGKAYRVLSSAFNQSMSAYQHVKKQEVLDTCFQVNSGENIRIPSVTFHFADGTDVDLDQSGVGLKFPKNIWCLAFTATKDEDDLTIIGNTQQREMEILYDIDAGKIGFGKKSCDN